MPLPTPSERIGTVVDGKYRIDRIIGEGGFGVVYAGVHLRLDRPVAIKFLHSQYSRSSEVVARFVREARATSRLSHPNVVDVRDVEIDPDGGVYMVLELLEGESLGAMLARRGTLSIAETITILSPVIDALATAHAAGIIHRDIKPDNVFLSRGPQGRVIPKVLDFGIAKLVDANSSSTATGAVMGTPIYMSPEQAMGRPQEIGPCSDVWSTAVMIYECLSGKFPFDISVDSTPTAVVVAVITGTIVPLADRRPDLPPAVSDLLARALERDPSARLGSMRALHEGLERVSARGSSETERPPPAPAAAVVAEVAPATVTGPIAAQDGRGAEPSLGRALSENLDVLAPPRSRSWALGLGVAAVGLAILVIAAATALSSGATAGGPTEAPPIAQHESPEIASPHATTEPPAATTEPPATPSVATATSAPTLVAVPTISADIVAPLTAEPPPPTGAVAPAVPSTIHRDGRRAGRAVRGRDDVAASQEPAAGTSPQTTEHRAGRVSLDEF